MLSRFSVLIYIHKNFYDLLIIITFFFIIPKQVLINSQWIFLRSSILWIWMVEWRNIFQFERVLFDKKCNKYYNFVNPNLGCNFTPPVGFLYLLKICKKYIEYFIIPNTSTFIRLSHLYQEFYVHWILINEKPKFVSSIHQTKKSSWLKNINFLCVHWWNIQAVEKLFLSSISSKKADDWKKQQVTVYTLIKYFISLCNFLFDRKSLLVNCIDSSFSINRTLIQEM